MPGECHAHLFMNGEDYKRAVAEHREGACESLIRKYLGAYRDAGISFVRDGGDRFGVTALAKKLAPEYEIDYRTPLFAICRKGHYGSIVGNAVENLREYRDAVWKIKKNKGDFIKIMVSGIMDYKSFGAVSERPLCESWIREMIAIAHDEGLSVMIHGNGREAVLPAVFAGADSLEHGNYIDKECLNVMAETGCVWVPTIATTKNLIGCGRYEDSVLQQIFEMECENIRYGYQCGVKIAVGSDAGAYLVSHGKGALQEEAYITECLYEAGYDIKGIKKRLEEAENSIKEKFQRK